MKADAGQRNVDIFPRCALVNTNLLRVSSDDKNKNNNYSEEM